MPEVHVQWIGDGRFVGTDSTKHSVVMSTAGSGVGLKPSDLLLVALGACSAVDVVGILQKKKVDLQSLHLRVSGEQDADPPWTFRKIHIAYLVKGFGLTPKAVEQAISLSEEKYCSVSATLRGVADISHSFEIVEDSDD